MFYGIPIKTANKLGYDLARGGDGIDLAYPNSKTRRGRVGHGVAKTIETGGNMGVLIKNERGNANAEGCENTREALRVLRGKIGEEAFCEWAARGLWCILSEAVLFERVYAKGIFEDWSKRPELVERSFFCKDSQPVIPTKEVVRNMWIEWQDRYPSYRQELSKQQFEQLKSFVQKLPHEVASSKAEVQALLEACEGIWILREALSEIQKIWQPDADWKMQRESYRIRKLTPLSCWRLMGFDDEDFEKAAKVNSNSQLYKQAGNSIVVDVLVGILGNLLGGKNEPILREPKQENCDGVQGTEESL